MHPHFNRFELENYARNAANAFVNEGVDLNDTITKMAEENEFTSHHVDRVVQNANIYVNAALVNRARDTGEDPRISFPLAKSAEVMQRVNSGTHKVAQLRKEAEVIDLFKVEKTAADRQRILDGTVGKMAPDPYANHARSVDHMKLATDFVRDSKGAAEDATTIDTQSLSRVCQTLENLQHRALTDHSMAKNAMDEAESVLRQEIYDQILYGSSPATVRDVMKQAGLDDKMTELADKLVTKVASEIKAREGKSAVTNGSLINKQHPLIVKAAAVKEKFDEAVRTRQGLDKFASAHQAAHEQYVRAAREGR